MHARTFSAVLMAGCVLLASCSLVPRIFLNAPPSVTSQAGTSIPPATVVRATVANVSPTPPATAYASSGLTVTVDLTGFSGAPILLRPSQRLQVVAPAAWGTLGWDVMYDPHFLELGPQIDVSRPLDTGWIWIPQRDGQTTIVISSVPDPCLKANPPCSVPVFGATLEVQIGN